MVIKGTGCGVTVEGKKIWSICRKDWRAQGTTPYNEGDFIVFDDPTRHSWLVCGQKPHVHWMPLCESCAQKEGLEW